MIQTPLKYVRATATNSCVPACLAMITGQTLQRVLKDIHEHWEAEGRFEGLEDDIIDQYLAKNGYAVQRLNHEYGPNKLLLDEWPLDPFAPTHLVDVWSSTPAGMHAVVMDYEGLIYDPSNKRIKRLSDYQRVFAMSGVWKVTDNLINIIR